MKRAERVAALRPVLDDLQRGRCFYCRGGLTRASHIDHFVPWTRYPVDLGYNFVLAHDKCYGAKGMMIAAEEHLAAWTERNVRHTADLRDACLGANVTADLDASVQIARWAYGQAFAAGALAWVRAKERRRLGAEWERAMRAASQVTFGD